ncbi:MAG: hypothetical protein GQ470_02835, partial [Gammaproteobacteria bacterium]|nr:hypothetical protein [Gammaproteobacteria bacterium]
EITANISAGTLQRVAAPTLYHNDSMVRRADALQATESAADAHKLTLNGSTAARLGVADEGEVTLSQGDFSRSMAIGIDDAVADDCFVLTAGTAESVGFGVDGNFEIDKV